jgi:hypothetical protein
MTIFMSCSTRTTVIARVGHLADQLIHLDGFLRIEAGGRLVEEDHPRLHGQGAGDLQALEGTVGHGVGAGLGVLLQADEAHQLEGLAAQLGVAAGDAREAQGGLDQVAVETQVGTHHHVLDGAHVHADLQVLEGARHTAAGQLVRRLATDGFAIQADLAVGGFVDPGDEVEQGRLAGAIGADHGIDDACVDAEAHILHGLDAAEVDGEVGDVEKPP